MKRLVALIVLSIGLGMAGLYLATRDALLDPAAYVPERLSLATVGLLVACLGAIWVVPLFKLRDLARAQGYRISAYQAWLAHIASVFGTAMTPSGTGGGPAMLVALNRFGVPAGAALSMAVQVLILDLVVFAVFIPVGLAYLFLVSPIGVPGSLEVAAVVAAAIGAAAALALARFPKPVVRLLLWVSRFRWLQRYSEWVASMAREYYRSANSFQKMRLGRWIELLGITVVAWLANFTLFWTLLLIYGIDAAPLAILAILSMLTLISFVVPTPGASGFMEFVVGVAVSGQVTAQTVAAPILFWRLGTFYLVYVLGPLSGWLILLDRPPRWMRRLARLRHRRRRDGSDREE